MQNIIIFGAPGSGKGTYSDAIVERYGMGHISTGDVLRSEIKNQTEVGKMAKDIIDKGQLIPDDLMIKILAKTYDSLPQGKGVIFDGFPRTIPQAEALKQMLKERGHDMGVMIELIVDENTLMERLLRRAQIEGRADDNEETIAKRFAVYQGSDAGQHFRLPRQTVILNKNSELPEFVKIINPQIAHTFKEQRIYLIILLLSSMGKPN